MNIRTSENAVRHGAILLCVLLLVMGLLPTSVFGNTEKEDTIRVGYYENEVFQEGARKGAVKTGYAYEYYRKLSEYTGWKYEYVYGDFTQLYEMLLEGKIDLMAGLAWRKDREKLIAYPDAPMGNETYDLVKHNTDEDVTAAPSTLKGKKIGVLDSAVAGVLEEFLKKEKVEADITRFSDYAALFQAFDDEKIDLMAAEGDGAYGRSDAEVLYSFGTSDYYLCANIRKPELLQTLNDAQTRLHTDEPDYINMLHSRHYPSSLSSRAFSDAEKAWLKGHDQLQVGYLNHYLPYSDTGEDGKVTGIISEMLRAMLERMDIHTLDLTFRGFDSYTDMMKAVTEGSVDAVFPVGGGLYYSEENGIYQTRPVVSASMELVHTGEFSASTTSHFAVNENNLMQYYYIKTNYPEAKITEYPTIEDCLEAVKDGAVTCTTLNGLRAIDILKNSSYSSLNQTQLAIPDDRCFGVRIGDEGLLRLLNRGISVLGDNYAANLASRYTAGLYTYTLKDMMRQHMAFFLLLVLAIIGLITLFLVLEYRRTRRELRDKDLTRQILEAKNRELEENRQELAVALASAENANRAKTTFLNNMSHDIRTPMNAIVGFTALAASHIDNKEQVQDYLHKITVSSQHLLSLINDVLDMSRIESGKMKLEEGEVHLPDLIHDLRTIILANMIPKQQEFFVDTQDVHNEDIITDKLRLNQILLNILSNAVKFTPVGGTISLRVIELPCSKQGFANFQFRVRDNGIGMSQAFQETIFDAFTREQTSTVSGIQGTGLGMAITKNIVTMMGGTIKVESEEGKGSEFIVGLQCRISGNPVKYEPVGHLQGVRALVVDDDAHTCLSVSSMLREIGMRPDWTNYGKEAVIRAQDATENADPFGVYIIDWLMPDLNGIETVRRIRAVIKDDTPIIILSAYDWADVEEEAREAGVTAFCSKPIFLSELREVLSRPFRCTKQEADGNSADVIPEHRKASDTEPPQSDTVTEPDFTGRKLLLAEDNEMNRQIAQAILTGAGFQLDMAEDGTEAVAKIQAAAPDEYDLILMDIQMPNMDGYEATRQIRAMEDPIKSRIPIVAMTANAFAEDRQMAIDVGMDDHVTKPYDIPRIMEVLGRLLKE